MIQDIEFHCDSDGRLVLTYRLNGEVGWRWVDMPEALAIRKGLTEAMNQASIIATVQRARAERKVR